MRKKQKPEQKQFIKTINEKTENDPTAILSPYLYPEEIKQYVPTDDNLSLFDLNMYSLGYHFHELEDLLTPCNIDFNIISITESRLQTKKKSLISKSLQGYNRTLSHRKLEWWGTTIHKK